MSKYVLWAYGIDNNGGILTIFILLLIASWLVRTYLTYIGVIGINRGIVRERKQKPVNFKTVFTNSQRFFGRYFSMTVLAGIGLTIVGLIFIASSGLTVNYTTVLGRGSICAGLIVAPLGIAISAWYGQAMIIMIITNSKISKALTEARDFIFKKHLGQYLVMMIINVFLVIGSIIVISFPNFVVSLGFNIRASLIPTAEAVSQTVGIVGRTFMLLSHLLHNFLLGILLVFLSAIWVHMYFDLKEGDKEENLPLPTERERLLQNLTVKSK